MKIKCFDCPIQPVPFNKYYKKFMMTEEYNLLFDIGYKNPKRISCGMYIKEMLDNNVPVGVIKYLIPNKFESLLRLLYRHRLFPHTSIDWKKLQEALNNVEPVNDCFFTFYPRRKLI